MKPNLVTLLTVKLTVVLILAIALRAVARAEPPTIAVAPMRADNTVSAQFETAGCGEELAQIFITELGKLTSFRVLENIDLDALKAEMKMGEDGWIEPGEKVEKGHFKGANYIFVARVTRFGASQKDIGTSGFRVPRPRLPLFDLVDVTIKKSLHEVQLDWRVVDTRTRVAVKTGRGIGTEKGTGFDFATVRGSGFMRNEEFQSSAMGKATMKAVASVVEELRNFQPPQASSAVAAVSPKTEPGVSGEVIYAKDATVIVSLGTKHGFKKGDRLGLFRVEETKDDDGTVVFTKRVCVGEIELVDTDTERSEATYRGDTPARKGWIVRQLAAN